MNTTLDRSQLCERYLFTGRLVLDTALHIGGGRESSTVTDSPILRDSWGRPLIPGSSFKGAFRATVERLVPNLSGFRTCHLASDSPNCLSTNSQQSKDYGLVSEAVGRGTRLGVGSDQVAKAERAALNRLEHDDWVNQVLGENQMLVLLDKYLCDTCKTFGSVHLAAVARFHDLPVVEPWAETTQIRDGVGIDRDSERAIDQIKFDYEVVPPQTEFAFRLTLENPRKNDLTLIALGLHEFLNGMVPLGGIRSRGLGQCHLQDIKLAVLNFTDGRSLHAYLTDKNWAETAATPLGDFVAQQTADLVAA